MFTNRAVRYYTENTYDCRQRCIFIASCRRHGDDVAAVTGAPVYGHATGHIVNIINIHQKQQQQQY